MRRIVMSETGFFAQKQRSPASLALVVLLHGALIAAVVLIKGPAFQRLIDTTTVRLIPIQPDPPPVQPPPPPHPERPQPPDQQIDQPRPLNQTATQQQTVYRDPGPTQMALNEGSGTNVTPVLPPPPPPPVPVRRAAQIDSASRLQPPYPPSEIRAGRDGRVQVRITIGPDGRVVDVARLSATSDAFFQATREQALRYWRFRPATVDGRPVEETRVMSVVFRLEDQA
jgi:protein TonB